MFFRLLLLLTVVPFVELTLLMLLAQWKGVVWTLVLIVVTGVVGTVLARSQGLAVWREIRLRLAAGEMPGASLLDGAMILLAGSLLLTPGLLTDLLGFSLLVPRCRRFYGRHLTRWFRRRMQIPERPPSAGRDEVLDSYVVGRTEEDDEPTK